MPTFRHTQRGILKGTSVERLLSITKNRPVFRARYLVNTRIHPQILKRALRRALLVQMLRGMYIPTDACGRCGSSVATNLVRSNRCAAFSNSYLRWILFLYPTADRYPIERNYLSDLRRSCHPRHVSSHISCRLA